MLPLPLDELPVAPLEVAPPLLVPLDDEEAPPLAPFDDEPPLVVPLDVDEAPLVVPLDDDAPLLAPLDEDDALPLAPLEDDEVLPLAPLEEVEAPPDPPPGGDAGGRPQATARSTAASPVSLRKLPFRVRSITNKGALLAFCGRGCPRACAERNGAWPRCSGSCERSRSATPARA